MRETVVRKWLPTLPTRLHLLLRGCVASSHVMCEGHYSTLVDCAGVTYNRWCGRGDSAGRVLSRVTRYPTVRFSRCFRAFRGFSLPPRATEFVSFLLARKG